MPIYVYRWWGRGAVGSTPDRHSGGHRFDSGRLHHFYFWSASVLGVDLHVVVA